MSQPQQVPGLGSGLAEVIPDRLGTFEPGSWFGPGSREFIARHGCLLLPLKPRACSSPFRRHRLVFSRRKKGGQKPSEGRTARRCGPRLSSGNQLQREVFGLNPSRHLPSENWRDAPLPLKAGCYRMRLAVASVSAVRQSGARSVITPCASRFD